MALLDFKKKELRNSVLTVRIPEDVHDKLKQIAEAHDTSQSVVIETLIEKAFEEFTKAKSKKQLR